MRPLAAMALPTVWAQIAWRVNSCLHSTDPQYREGASNPFFRQDLKCGTYVRMDASKYVAVGILSASIDLDDKRARWQLSRALAGKHVLSPDLDYGVDHQCAFFERKHIGRCEFRAATSR